MCELITHSDALQDQKASPPPAIQGQKKATLPTTTSQSNAENNPPLSAEKCDKLQAKITAANKAAKSKSTRAQAFQKPGAQDGDEERPAAETTNSAEKVAKSKSKRMQAFKQAGEENVDDEEPAAETTKLKGKKQGTGEVAKPAPKAKGKAKSKAKQGTEGQLDGVKPKAKGKAAAKSKGRKRSKVNKATASDNDDEFGCLDSEETLSLNDLHEQSEEKPKQEEARR